MADVAAAIENWSTTASSNLPADATTIGAGLADNFQQIQATVRAHLASKGADIASATTTDIGAVAGLAHDITGTTSISSFGTVSAGVWKILQFDGALTLTHNGTSLILPGAVNITTAAGDVGVFISEGSGNWRCVSYSGKNIAGNNLVLTGDLAVNGGDLTTSATTFNLLNATATTVNFAGGASTALNIGNASGTNTVLGATTFSQGVTLSSALTYGGVALSNAVTGTGNMVLSASPTLTGTLAAASGTFSGTLGVTGAFSPGSWTSSTSTGYDSSSFTGTATTSYYTVEQTGTFKYTRVGNSVVLYFPTISGTSNSTSLRITGLPASLTPTSDQAVFYRATDNGGAAVTSLAVVRAAGYIDYYLNADAGSFTASGTKAINEASISYGLN